MLKHIKTWDFETFTLKTKQNTEIKCHGGESHAVCRVIAKERVDIPSHSVMYVSISIPEGRLLATTCYVEGLQTDQFKEKHIAIVSGIIDPHNDTAGVGVMNQSNESVTIHVGTGVGTGKSSYEVFEPETHTCANVEISLDYDDKQSLSPEQQTGQLVLPEHLKDMFDKSCIHLNTEEKQSFAALLIKYESVFAKSSADLGQTDRVKHKINTGTAAPIRQQPRRQPFGKRDTEKQEIDKMLERDVIEPSNSAWASPVVLVSKKDGSTRFCVDYRRLNDVTVKDAYPLPRVDDCLDALAGAKWFNCMNLNSGFWQIEMEPDDKEKTAFTTSYGLFQLKVMRFGLVNARSIF